MHLVHPLLILWLSLFLMEKEKNEKNNAMGSDSSDKTPNGDSNLAEDQSHATNEDLEGKRFKSKKLKKFS